MTEVSELKDEIARLQRLVGNRDAPGNSEESNDDAEVNGDDIKIDRYGGDCDNAAENKKRAVAYTTLTEKLKTLPTTDRVKVVQQMTSPSKLKKQRITSQLAKDVGLDRRSITVDHRGQVSRLVKSENRKEQVLAFLQLPDHSVTLAGKKDTVTVNGEKKQKVILTQFLKPLHQEYNDSHPDQLVSLSFFTNVRRKAKFIKTLNYHSTAVCLCIQHQNFALKLRSIAACGIPTIPDTLSKEYTQETFLARLNAAQLPETVCFQTWKRVPVPYGDPSYQKVSVKLRPVEQNMPRAEFIAVLMADFDRIAKHIFRATSQHQAIRSLRQEMTAEECTIQMDFANNWNIGYSEEVQSAFYAKDSITLHPAVIHVRYGNSTVSDCLSIVSDDRTHDAGAILAIMTILTKYISELYPQVKTLHYCSDSPSSQYRNISMFSVIAKHRELFGQSCTWAYFESGHGKGPCDGVGAAAKRKADTALQKGNNIVNAEDFVRLGNIDGNVTYIHLPLSASYRARKDLNTLVTKRSVPGTMKVHAVVTLVPSQKIAVRETSCYKDCCWSNLQPKIGCSGWKQHTLFSPSEKTDEIANDTTALVTNHNPTESTDEIGSGATAVVTGQDPTDSTGEIGNGTTAVVTGQDPTNITGEIASGTTAVVTGQDPTDSTGEIASGTIAVVTGQDPTDSTGEIGSGITAVVTGQDPTDSTGEIASGTTAVVTGQDPTDSTGEIGSGTTAVATGQDPTDSTGEIGSGMTAVVTGQDPTDSTGEIGSGTTAVVTGRNHIKSTGESSGTTAIVTGQNFTESTRAGVKYIFVFANTNTNINTAYLYLYL